MNEYIKLDQLTDWPVASVFHSFLHDSFIPSIAGWMLVAAGTCFPQRGALLKSMLNFLKKAITDTSFSDSIRHREYSKFSSFCYTSWILRLSCNIVFLKICETTATCRLAVITATMFSDYIVMIQNVWCVYVKHRHIQVRLWLVRTSASVWC